MSHDGAAATEHLEMDEKAELDKASTDAMAELQKEATDDFPDGGWRAWSQVVGGFPIAFVAWGWVNCEANYPATAPADVVQPTGRNRRTCRPDRLALFRHLP